MVDAALDFSFSIRIAHFARKCRNAVVRQNVAIQGIQARIVEVRRQHSLAKIVQDHDPRRTTKPAKCLLVKLGPHPRTGSEHKQPNRFPAATKRHYKQPRATILAAIGIAHHRTRAVINLALLTGFRLDDYPRFSRYRSAQLEYESLNTLIAACEPVLIDKILPDSHRVAAPDELQLDHLPIRFTGSGRALASLLPKRHSRQKAGDHFVGRFCRFFAKRVGRHRTGRLCRRLPPPASRRP